MVFLHLNSPVDDPLGEQHLPRPVDALVFRSCTRILADMAPYCEGHLHQRFAIPILKLNEESLTHEPDP